MTNHSMINDSIARFFPLLFLSPPAEFPMRLTFLKFELKNFRWDGKVLVDRVSQSKVQQHFSPCPS